MMNTEKQFVQSIISLTHIWNARSACQVFRVVVTRGGACEWVFEALEERSARATLKRAGYPSGKKVLPVSAA